MVWSAADDIGRNGFGRVAMKDHRIAIVAFLDLPLVREDCGSPILYCHDPPWPFSSVLARPAHNRAADGCRLEEHLPCHVVSLDTALVSGTAKGSKPGPRASIPFSERGACKVLGRWR